MARKPLSQTAKFLHVSKIFLILSISLTVIPSWSATVLDELEETPFPTVKRQQIQTTRLIHDALNKNHLKKFNLDNELSQKVLQRYLQRLDPSKSYFLSSDIDAIEKQQYNFDDYIKTGEIQAVFSIFKIFRNRLEQRIKRIITRLEQPFDFSLHENLLIDRSKTSWQPNLSAQDDYWRKKIKNDILNLRFSGKTNEEITKTLKERYIHTVRQVRHMNADDVFQIFINTYTSTIEPHTVYYPPRAVESFNIQMSLKITGIGIILFTDNEHTVVRRVIPGGPADLTSELQPNDKIIGVAQDNGSMIDIIGWRLDDVADLIRGEKQTTVKLELLPAQQGLSGKSKVISIVRDKINLEEQAAKKYVIDVKTEFKESRFGVIKLPSFYRDFTARNKGEHDFRSSTKDLKTLITELSNDNVDGLIIDLRGNSGGALPEAIQATGLFIKHGPIIQVKQADGRINIGHDIDSAIFYDGPLAVMVDRHSASASEIFAGAIQDYNRGLIIGEQTYGKGTVQNVITLNNLVNTDHDIGNLNLTIAQFFRVNGDSTQKQGIIPDIDWEIFKNFDEFGEKSLNNSLPWRKLNALDFHKYHHEYDPETLNWLKQRHKTRIASNPYFHYALEIESINKLNRQQKYLSLNEENRKKMETERDQKRLKLENEKRAALGQNAFSSIEDLANNQKKLLEDLRHNKNNREYENDAFIRETGRILSDFTYSQDYPSHFLLTGNQPAPRIYL